MSENYSLFTGGYPRQNGLAVALRELGKIERTLFLQYISSVELRRRIHVGLNKGEARNALARAVFFNRLGELRDRTHENQRHRASGLNLVVAAIVLWNTVYLERAVAAIRQNGQTVSVSDETLAHLSPLKWEHHPLSPPVAAASAGRRQSAGCDAGLGARHRAAIPPEAQTVSRPPFEVADIVRRLGDRFLEMHRAWLTSQHRRVLRALVQCRTAALGGHRDRCEACTQPAFSYNSCLMGSDR